MTRATVNVHATVVLVGERAVAITGASGAGKSSLALALVSAEQAAGRFAAIVCDDRAEISEASGCLVARPPAAIAGLAEVRGFGVAAVSHESAAVIALRVDLVAADAAGRMMEPSAPAWLGVALPRLVLAAGSTGSAVRAVQAALGMLC